jgi:hypothetical protein
VDAANLFSSGTQDTVTKGSTMSSAQTTNSSLRDDLAQAAEPDDPERGESDRAGNRPQRSCLSAWSACALRVALLANPCRAKTATRNIEMN